MEKARQIIEIQNRIYVLKEKLKNSDYITDKLVSAIVEYIVNGDRTPVLLLYDEYQEKLTKRQEYRDEINTLEEQLKIIKGE